MELVVNDYKIQTGQKLSWEAAYSKDFRILEKKRDDVYERHEIRVKPLR